jgi:hypothetical protein
MEAGPGLARLAREGGFQGQSKGLIVVGRYIAVFSFCLACSFRFLTCTPSVRPPAGPKNKANPIANGRLS